MAAKRRARQPRTEDSKELGLNGGNEGSDEEEEESSKSDALKRAEQPSPPSPEDAEAERSGEASPQRSKPRGWVAMKTKTTTSKRVKKPSPASEKEYEAGDSGDLSPASDPLPDNIVDAGDNKRPATLKPGKKRSPTPQQEEERPEKRAAGSDGETVATSSPQRKKKSKRSVDKDRRKKKNRNQIRKALTQEDEDHDTVMAEQEQSNTSLPQDEHAAREEEQEEKMAQQEHAGDTSHPHDKDMRSAHGEEQQDANQEHADDTSPAEDNHSVDEEEQQVEPIPQQEQPNDTSPPQEKNRAQEDEETRAQVNGKALEGRNAPSTKLRSFESEKKPAVERSWSYDDELKILNALVEHAQSHNGSLPDSSHVLANLTFDKIDANEDKLTDKIRKLRTRYRRWLLQGCTPSVSGSQLFKLSEILWGQADEDEQVEPTSRDFSVVSKLYPHLAKEVKAYAETHSSGDLIMGMVMTICDKKARDLDAKCKKQQIETFKLELGQANLTNELLSALSSQTHVKF